MGSTLKYPPDRYDTGVLDFEFSLDATLLAVLYGQYGGRLDMWDVAAGTFQSLTSDDLRSYQQVEFSPDGSRLAVGPSFDPPSTDYQVEIWESIGDTWTRQRVLVDARPGFAFSPDGTMLVTHSGVSSMVSMDNPGPPVLWDVVTGARQRELQVDGFPASLAYSPDGKTVAINTIPEGGGISGETGTFLVDVDTGEVRHFIRSLDGNFPVTGFSIDGSLLVAVYFDANQITLWDVQTGNQMLALDVPAGGLSSFFVSFPRSAWECPVRRSASSTRVGLSLA